MHVSTGGLGCELLLGGIVGPVWFVPRGGSFDRVGVNILQLPLTLNGNQYALVFIDYLTKWVEVVAITDQKAETIAQMFVEYIICRHGAP